MKTVAFYHKGLDYLVNVDNIVHLTSDGGMYRTVTFADGGYLEDLSIENFERLIDAMNGEKNDE